MNLMDRRTEGMSMAAPRFARPKSLYIEATAIMDDDTERVYRMKFEPSGDESQLTLDLDNLFDEVDDFTVPYKYERVNGLHNIKVEFTRCYAVDPVPASQ